MAFKEGSLQAESMRDFEEMPGCLNLSGIFGSSSITQNIIILRLARPKDVIITRIYCSWPTLSNTTGAEGCHTH